MKRIIPFSRPEPTPSGNEQQSVHDFSPLEKAVHPAMTQMVMESFSAIHKAVAPADIQAVLGAPGAEKQSASYNEADVAMLAARNQPRHGEGNGQAAA